MLSARGKANALYALIAFVFLVFFLLLKYDSPVPTKKIVVGYVQSVVAEQNKNHIMVNRAYIQIVNGPTIIKNANQFNIGQKYTFRVYRTKLTRRVRYVKQ